jgi:hypothetical protein
VLATDSVNWSRREGLPSCPEGVPVPVGTGGGWGRADELRGSRHVHRAGC